MKSIVIGKFLLLFTTFLVFSSTSFAQNITPDMIEKAKAAGITQEQIDAALKAKQQQSSSTTPVVTPVEEESPEVNRNKKAQTLYNNPVEITEPRKEGVIFGREIFSQKNLTFAPNFNIPTPKNYKIGPNDQLIINIWGASEDNLTKTVTAEGRIVIPTVGPIQVGGLSIEGAESKIRSALAKVYGGLNSGSTHLTLSLGDIRSIKVNIVGEVAIPGTYTLPSLATLFNAIYVAGGVNNIGSLRNIKVYRNSKQVGELDVYDYLLNGKYDSNVRLEDNDMIVISPYDKIVTINGNVKRDRKFEMKKGETLDDLIRFAGGFTSEAYSENLSINRSTGREFEVYNISKKNFKEFAMQDGDVVSVGRILDRYTNRVVITGAVFRPGAYALGDSISTLLQLVNKAEGVKEDAFLSRVLITRLRNDLSKEVIAVDLKSLLMGSAQDIELQKWDEVYVPSIKDLTEDYTVSIYGAVTNPKTIPFKHNMTVEDLIVEAGGLKYNASLQRIEVARRIRDPYTQKQAEKQAEVFQFNITEDFRVSPEAKRFSLQPYDEVYVRVSPGYEDQKKVHIDGEVLFRGDYALATKNLRLSELIKLAGGVTKEAFIKGARLTRTMNSDERARLHTLLKIANQSNSKDSISTHDLDLGNTYFVGIKLDEALKHPGSDDDIVLREGDFISVPQFNNTVRISGAVLYPNTVTYTKSLSLRNYVSMAGGYDSNAKRSKAFVIYMNGTVSKGRSSKIEPGCEIVIPIKPERRGKSAVEVLGLASSTASIAAMIATMYNIFK